MALCSVSDVESISQLDYESALQTDITNVFIPYVDSAIKRFLGYDVEYNASITEKFDGKEKTHLFLKVVPVVSITSVVEDGFTLTSGNDADYVAYLEEGYLVKTSKSRWSDARMQNITVTYAAGFQTIPEVIRFTSARAVSRLLNGALQLSSQQPKSEIKSHKSDASGNDGNFYSVQSESISDLSLAYGDPLNAPLGPALTAFDITALMPYKRIFFD
tara:strand:- start:23647 stop:24297 length:651 start_codon:yes stop_codon:yes gene_type:complete